MNDYPALIHPEVTNRMNQLHDKYNLLVEYMCCCPPWSKEYQTGGPSITNEVDRIFQKAESLYPKETQRLRSSDPQEVSRTHGFNLGVLATVELLCKYLQLQGRPELIQAEDEFSDYAR